MTKLPVVSGDDCIRALERHGFRRKRQRGSHVLLERVNPLTTITVPLHRELRPGTLRAIIRHAGIDAEMFVEWLRS